MADRELTTNDLSKVSRDEEPQEARAEDAPLARDDAATGGETPRGRAGEHEPLLPDDQGSRFRERWLEIQGDFVDHPRQSVEAADTLVADLMQRLAASFANERQTLEGQWDRGDDVSTEDLRVALTRYRSFFDRLLSA